MSRSSASSSVCWYVADVKMTLVKWVGMQLGFKICADNGAHAYQKITVGSRTVQPEAGDPVQACLLHTTNSLSNPHDLV